MKPKILTNNDSKHLFPVKIEKTYLFKHILLGHFFRSGHNISFNNDIDSEQSLFSLKFCNKDIKLEPNDYNYDSDASCWIIAKNQTNLLKGIQYQLSIGDFIKLGRMYFKLKEVVINEEIKSPIILKEQRLDKIIFSPCKICLSDSFEDDDPLISLCRCIGSLKYIHLRCLKEWLNSKVSLKCMESYSLITWEKLECELCKTALSCKNNNFFI